MFSGFVLRVGIYLLFWCVKFGYADILVFVYCYVVVCLFGCLVVACWVLLVWSVLFGLGI